MGKRGDRQTGLISLDAARMIPATKELLPGIMFCLMLAAGVWGLSDIWALPVMLMALVVGMTCHRWVVGGRLKGGIDVSSRTILRWGVALLGARITLADVTVLGVLVIGAVVGLVLLTIVCGVLLAKSLGKSWRLGILTGGAVAICGASATLAMAAVLQQIQADEQPGGDRSFSLDRDTLVTVFAVTTLSTIAMIVYPWLFDGLGYDHWSMGVLIGATIHDVAQVVGAGYGVSELTGDTATLVKLWRVTLLPVTVVLLSVILLSIPDLRPGDSLGTDTVRRSWFGPQILARIRIPWFIGVFVLLVVINSVGWLPDRLQKTIEPISTLMLVTAIVALGLKTTLRSLWSVGPAYMVLIVLETLILLVAALVLLG